MLVCPGVIKTKLSKQGAALRGLSTGRFFFQYSLQQRYTEGSLARAAGARARGK